MILGFSGKKQSGKTTAIEDLKKRLYDSYAVHNFADSLKIMVVQTLVPAGMKPANLSSIDWVETNKDTLLPCGMTVRQALQFVGTDVFRTLWPDVWINAWKNRLPAFTGPKAVKWLLVADIRFLNEVQAIKDIGGHVIRLTRAPYNDDHASETELDHVPEGTFDVVLDNNGMSIDQQNKAVWDIVFNSGWLNDKH